MTMPGAGDVDWPELAYDSEPYEPLTTEPEKEDAMTEEKKLDQGAVENIGAQSTDIVEAAAGIEVVDEATLAVASALLTGAKALMAEVDEVFGPPTKAAHAAHKAIVAARRKVETPLKVAETKIKASVAAYHTKLRRAAEEARRKEAERLARLEEDRRLEAALKAEEAGDSEKAEEIIETKPETARAPIITTPPPPKVEGISTAKRYTAEVRDTEAFLAWVFATKQWDEFIDIKQARLNQMARVHKAQEKMPPGVQLLVDTTVRSV